MAGTIRLWGKGEVGDDVRTLGCERVLGVCT